ncbi:MAG: molybdenum cofactor biosynthesis protein MoaE [Polyangiaceae bacterium]
MSDRISPAESAAAHAAPSTKPRAERIRSARLSMDELVEQVRHPGAGAVATFEGTVRNFNDGRAVTLLEYEAYGPMAESELARILDELHAELPDVRAAAVHRIGALSVGDAAVLCAASAPHRGEAFRACRLLIDRIKARLPIWKREHGPDGPYWVGWEDARCFADDHDHAHDHSHPAGPAHDHGDAVSGDGAPAHAPHRHR